MMDQCLFYHNVQDSQQFSYFKRLQFFMQMKAELGQYHSDQYHNLSIVGCLISYFFACDSGELFRIQMPLSSVHHLSRFTIFRMFGKSMPNFMWIIHSWEGGTKVYMNCPGHMTKMAAMSIYGKNL